MFSFNVTSRELEKEYVKQEQALRVEEEKTETKRRIRRKELDLRKESGDCDPDHTSNAALCTNHTLHDQVPANHAPDAQMSANHTPHSQPPIDHAP